MRNNLMIGALMLSLWACDGSSEPTPPTPPAQPEAKPEIKARVFFVEPADGATITSPVKVKMGVEGMTVQPAGELKEGTGHHHIIIDKGGIAEGQAVPADEQHIHYGKGQTETELELTPGKHSLTLQFANGLHQSYGEVMASTITITVEANEEHGSEDHGSEDHGSEEGHSEKEAEH